MKTCLATGLATVVVMLAAALVFPVRAEAQASQARLTFTDMVGRTVALPGPAKRIVLAEANDLLSLALIDPDPVARLVGWAALRRFDAGMLELYRKKFPATDRVAVVGDWTADTFSVEKTIALRPDLVLMTAFQDPRLGTGEFAKQFEMAGIPVAFVTSAANTRTSATDIAPRLRMLGKILGREAQAEEYIAFYHAKLGRVTGRLAKATIDRPKVLIETYAGLSECCRAPGRHGWAEFVELAGGSNLAAAAPSEAGGMLSMEYLIAQNPDIYLGNGGSYLHDKGLVIGPAYSTEQTRASLRKLIDRPGFKDLKAVRDGRVYAMWTVLGTQPVNILAVERLAKWFHPRLFGDLDPSATLDEINRRFAAVAMPMPLWLALDERGEAR